MSTSLPITSDTPERPEPDHRPSTSERPTSTRHDAEQYVSACLGEHAAGHDVATITEALREVVDSWDVRQVEPEQFWQVVRSHALPVDGCPSWCTEHPANDEPGTTTHTTTVTVGTTSVEVEQIDGITPGPNDPAGAYVVPPEVVWVDGQDVHDLAAALAIAAQIVHPLGGVQ